MGRRLAQYLNSFGDDGRPKVAWVFDDEEAPEGAEVVYRLRLNGRPVEDLPELVAGARAAPVARRS